MSDDDEEHCSVAKPELSDDPKISSAALCITLDLLGQTFRPEFTHQCFPGERIRGYQPYQEVIPKDKWHKSYEEHDAANQELAVMVQLAPSGQTCQVEVKIRKKRFLRERQPRLCSPTKRRKVESDDDTDDNPKPSSDSDAEESLGSRITTEEDEDDENESEFSEGDAEDNGDDEDPVSGDVLDPEGDTRHSRMSSADIVYSLKKALPNVKRRGSVKNDFLRKPIGLVIHTYERKGAEFCITLAQGTEAATYHSSIQRLALLFIENADDVDITSQDDGYWKVMYLFRKHSPQQYSLAGFVTLFHFSAPFRKPLPGTIVRVCQAVILPPYQREGHGREMLHKVHDLAQGSSGDDLGKYGRSIVEINVEDPAPGFVALRNLVDYERYQLAKKTSKDWFKDSCRIIENDSYFELLSESAARELSRQSKLTIQQMQIVYEIDRLCGLHSTGHRLSDSLEKKYRLMVKKRLNRDNKEELGACRNKESMKQLLEEIYQEHKSLYDRIVARVLSVEGR